MSKGGKPQTQTTSIDPASRAAYLNNLDLARSTAGGLGVQQFAGFDPMYQAAEKASYEASMKPFGAEDIRAFQNPYETDVINAAMGDIDRQRQMQAMRDSASAIGAKAFGGSRQAVQGALTNEAYDRNAGQLASTMRSQGYNTAAQLAQAARQMNLSGYQNAMNLGLTRQQFAQLGLDAERNLPLQRLAIQQAAMSAQPANLGQTSSQPTTKNAASGALGGAMAGFQMSGGNPWVAAAGGLLGALG
jgi:hypothetical protein